MSTLLFAANLLESLASPYGIALVVFIILTSLFLFLAKRYRRCPSNAILVIYGSVGAGKSAKTVHGGGAFILPIIQDYDYLSLEPIQIEVPLKDALSHENIRVNVPSVFTVAIGTEPEVMQNAAVRLLGLKTIDIKKQAEDIIFGQLRQVIASMRIEDINRDRDAFLSNIHQNLEPELEKIGLVLINVNITDITDESGYIEAIGQRAAAEAVQNARADVAEQEKLGEIRVAAADRDKLVEVADANKTKEIGIREAARAQAVRVAELNKEQDVAEQRADFERDTAVADAQREKRIAVAQADAAAIEGETESKAKIADANATLNVRQAEAYEIGETRKREAAAAVEEAQHPSNGEGRTRGSRTDRSRTSCRVGSTCEGDESQDNRGSRSRCREAKTRSRRRGRCNLRSTRRGSSRGVRKTREEGGRSQRDRRCLWWFTTGLPTDDARTSRHTRREERRGDLEYQVRQDHCVGQRRKRLQPQRRQYDKQLPAKHVTHTAANDASHERHRGRGNAGVFGQIRRGRRG